MTGPNRLFLFDCYDTLIVDREPGVTVNPAELFARHLDITVGLSKRILYPLLAAAFRPGLVQERTETGLQRGLDRYDLGHRMEDALEALWWAAGNADGRYRAATGCAELLRDIKRAGHEIRLISNCVLDVAGMQRLLADVELAGYIDQAYFSSEGQGKKPDTVFFRRAAEGSWDEVVMIGDSADLDIGPATSLGWQAVRIEPAGPRWEAVAGHL